MPAGPLPAWACISCKLHMLMAMLQRSRQASDVFFLPIVHSDR